MLRVGADPCPADLRRKSIEDSPLYHNAHRREGDIHIFTLRLPQAP